MELTYFDVVALIDDLREENANLTARIAELEAEIDIRKDQLREAKNILIDKNLQIDSLYEEGYKLQQRIAELEEKRRWIPVGERLPEKNGWYLCGMVSFLGKTFTNEIYFDTVNIDPRWNNCTQDRVYCWLDGVPEQPEVQE